MKNITKSILFLAMVAFFFSSCEKDEFSEKDAMQELQHIDVVINVTDGSSYAEVIEDASVQLVGDSTTSSMTTDAGGNVTFTDVPVGSSLSVYVHKENYTKSVYTLSTLTNSYRESIVTKSLKIYSLNSDNMATVKGQITLETDLTNRAPETLAGKEVRVINNSLEGEVERSFVATTDENGNYSLKVPVTSRGDDELKVIVPSLVEADQTLAIANEDGTYEVVTVPASFHSSDFYDSYDFYVSNHSEVIRVPSAYAVIDAPTGNGSGFELGVEVKPTAFDEYSNIEILKGGRGYRADTISLSTGVNGRAAEVIVYVDGNGAITDLEMDYYYYYNEYGWSDVEYLDNGALYTSAPTLDLSSLSGSGAVLDIEFNCLYAIYIKNNGNDYFSIPDISMEYKEYQNHTLVNVFEKDMYFNDFLKIHDGSIYTSDWAFDDDTLTYGVYAEMPELTISEASSESAVIPLFVNENGEIEAYTYTSFLGAGFDPANPPACTVNTVAGYGSGAELKVEVGTDGSISDIHVVDGGQGYVQNVNDYAGDGFDPRSGDGFNVSGGDLDIDGVGSGDVLVRDIYYGTGMRK